MSKKINIELSKIMLNFIFNYLKGERLLK